MSHPQYVSVNVNLGLELKLDGKNPEEARTHIEIKLREKCLSENGVLIDPGYKVLSNSWIFVELDADDDVRVHGEYPLDNNLWQVVSKISLEVAFAYYDDACYRAPNQFYRPLTLACFHKFLNKGYRIVMQSADKLIAIYKADHNWFLIIADKEKFFKWWAKKDQGIKNYPETPFDKIAYPID